MSGYPREKFQPLMLQNHLTLAAWLISGNHPSRQVDFLRMQSLYCVSWRRSTAKSYEPAWGKWVSWCGSQNVNPFQASIHHITEYLTNLFQESKEYSTINTSRSMLSVTLSPPDGSVVGKHPLICCFTQGVFNSRLPMPRYSFEPSHTIH